VDLDPEMTKLFSSNPMLTALNANSLTASRLHIVNADAFPWLAENRDVFDFVVVDFPDPTNYSLGKLYTTVFYRALAKHLSRQALVVVQSTSPLFARQSYWCIVETLKQAGLKTFPYHVYVPSFGEWGFVLAGQYSYEPPALLPGGLRFLSARNLPELFHFPNDMLQVDAEPNRLNDQVLVRYYEREWREISH
jgi:spermidine synthase